MSMSKLIAIQMFFMNLVYGSKLIIRDCHLKARTEIAMTSEEILKNFEENIKEIGNTGRDTGKYIVSYIVNHFPKNLYRGNITRSDDCSLVKYYIPLVDLRRKANIAFDDCINSLTNIINAENKNILKIYSEIDFCSEKVIVDVILQNN